MPELPDNSRRDFLTGKSARNAVRNAGDQVADAIAENRPGPQGQSTLRLTQRAMACEFTVILNPGIHEYLPFASDALRLVEPLEDQMSVFREHSELSRLNRAAADGSVVVERNLFNLLQQAIQISQATDGAFDPTLGPLLALWRSCRKENRIPTDEEIGRCRQIVGVDHVQADDSDRSLSFDAVGVELDLGGIGKGYALDRMAAELQSHDAGDFLLHGGYSSIFAAGEHNNTGGWPVGIGNPLFTEKRMGTVLLKEKAMSTSGSNIQYFRVGGRRYGHILDPQTGWPVENLLSVTVLADSAAKADALSTAFFVIGVENTRRCCDTLDGVGVIMIPFPERGRKVTPTVIGIPDDALFWDDNQVELVG
jgi:thiamine biosynthesis lipoprotein